MVTDIIKYFIPCASIYLVTHSSAFKVEMNKKQLQNMEHPLLTNNYDFIDDYMPDSAFCIFLVYLFIHSLQ